MTRGEAGATENRLGEITGADATGVAYLHASRREIDTLLRRLYPG